MSRYRLLFGISVFWLALSMLFDGLNTLVLPNYLLRASGESKATTLGLLTFAGLVLGMVVQPVAGAWSDQLRPRRGRQPMLALGVLLTLAVLGWLGAARTPPAVFAAYLLVQVTASIAQAAQQGFIPDLVPAPLRGTAAGFKGLMDIGGAMLGFVVLGQLLGSESLSPALLAIAAVLGGAFLLSIVLVREPPRAGDTPPDRTRPRDAFQLDLRWHQVFAWLVVSRFLFLLGTYMVGRFLLFFVADRLNLNPGRAAEEAGTLLAGLALITVVAALPAGWAADRWGRMPLMVVGAVLSAAGVLLLTIAGSGGQILLFGSLMAVGSAAYGGASWALTADLAPTEEAGRFFGLANVGTAGAAAAAGLFGPLVDWGNQAAPGLGYLALFVAAALAFVASAVVLRRGLAAGDGHIASRQAG